MKRILSLFAAAVICFIALTLRAEERPLVMRVDHFYAESDQARSLFIFFKDTFQLPEGWPFRDAGTHASGGLWLGNAILEFVTFPPKDGKPVKTEFRGIAFEPASGADETAIELTKRGISRGEVENNMRQGPDGHMRVTHSLLDLKDFPPVEASIFFVDYKFRKSAASKYKAIDDEFAARNRGALGIVGASEITIGVRDLEEARRKWSTLLTPLPQISDDAFVFNAGPRIRLVRAESPGIQGIVLSVRSLNAAEKYLKDHGILARDDAGRIFISPAAIDGLRIELQNVPLAQREARLFQELPDQTLLDKWARVLVRYSLDLQPGQSLLIRSETEAEDLILAVYREALLAGAYPYIRCDLPGQLEVLFRTATDDQLANLNALARLEMGFVDAALRIEAPANTKELTGVDSRQSQIFQRSNGRISEIVFKRVEGKELKRCLTAYPTNALAQEADMGLWEYRDFVFKACKLEEPDPVAAWKSGSHEQHEIARRFQGKDKVSLKGPNIDLTLSIKGRPFVVCDGKVNFPDGEIFTSPLEDSANGWVRFNYPGIYYGRQVDNVELWFENGKVVKEKAGQGQDFLTGMLNTDEGARRLGELGIRAREPQGEGI